jgi:hypothetical protein
VSHKKQGDVILVSEKRNIYSITLASEKKKVYYDAAFFLRCKNLCQQMSMARPVYYAARAF